MGAQSAEYVAVPRKWCVAHHGVMEEDEFCEHADSYETPCVLRRLFIEDPSDHIDGPELDPDEPYGVEDDEPIGPADTDGLIAHNDGKEQ